jgi:NADPH:quinone reductase and related Zn-dependent oxidoreductases
MKTMKAVRIHTYGGPEVLEVRGGPAPKAGTRRTLDSGLCCWHKSGGLEDSGGVSQTEAELFAALDTGWDLSGVVEATGLGIVRLKAGDEVYSRPDIARDGAYAEYIAVRETEIALKPKSIDHIHAAAIPLAALTAWQSLFDAAGLSAGQTVLIHAAAGGVGSFAVQLAKWKGAHVIGTASKRNQDVVRNLGADETIDYQTTRFEDVVHDADVVFDTIGGDTQKRSWKALKKGGILVSIVGSPSAEEAAAHGVRQASVFVQPIAAQLTELANLVDSGKLRSIVETVLPLSEARRAHELSRTGHTRGKIVLRVS